MARIFSHLDAAGEFLGRSGGHSSAGSHKSRPLVGGRTWRPEDSVPSNDISDSRKGLLIRVLITEKVNRSLIYRNIDETICDSEGYP